MTTVTSSLTQLMTTITGCHAANYHSHGQSHTGMTAVTGNLSQLMTTVTGSSIQLMFTGGLTQLMTTVTCSPIHLMATVNDHRQFHTGKQSHS